jgi:hypothetical protein
VFTVRASHQARLAANLGAESALADPTGTHRAAIAAVVWIVKERRADPGAFAVPETLRAAERTLGAPSPVTDTARADDAARAAVGRVGGYIGAHPIAIDEVSAHAVPDNADEGTVRAGAIGEAGFALGPLPGGSGQRPPRQPGGKRPSGKEAQRLATGGASGYGTRNGIKGEVVHGILPDAEH